MRPIPESTNKVEYKRQLEVSVKFDDSMSVKQANELIAEFIKKANEIDPNFKLTIKI